MNRRINIVLFSLAGVISVILLSTSMGGSWQSLGQTSDSTGPASQTTTTQPQQGTAGTTDSPGVSSQTVTVSVAESKVVSYNLASGATSGSIAIPVANSPVLVMGVQTTVGNRGVGEVTILRVAGSFLEWTGLDSTAGSAITQGFSGVPGTKIVFIDFAHCVRIEVHNADSIQVHNTCGAAQTGQVKLIW